MESYQGNLMGKEVAFEPIHESMRARVKEIQAGDLGLVESMLFSQAQALQTIFSSLARRAAGQEQLKHYQTSLMLSMKAQAQSRATLEALIELKHPRQQPTFVKQANIAHGPQQVNNGATPPRETAHACAHAAEDASPQNELLEAPHGNELDIGAQAQTGRVNPHLETVAAGHGAAHP
jgi:hypothetical protein